jgi:hypothetical protein
MEKKFYSLQELRFYCRIVEDLRVLECYALPIGKQLPMSRTNACIQGVPGGKDLTSGECSLGQTIPI